MKKILSLMAILFITSVNANEKIDIIGTIYYSRPLNTFSVIYLKDEKAASHFIQVKNQNEFNKLKSLVGKSIRVEGYLNWSETNNELFSLKEKLVINNISNFELNHLTLDTQKLTKENTFSNENIFKPNEFSTTIEISDKTANGLISTAAVVLGVVVGPIIIVPLAIFGITQLVN